VAWAQVRASMTAMVPTQALAPPRVPVSMAMEQAPVAVDNPAQLLRSLQVTEVRKEYSSSFSSFSPIANEFLFFHFL
jgi:hypothetical protein